MKVVATAPLVGCGGSEPSESLPGVGGATQAQGGAAGTPAGVSGSAAGSGVAGGASIAGSGSTSTSGSTFGHAGTFGSGGNPFPTGGTFTNAGGNGNGGSLAAGGAAGSVSDMPLPGEVVTTLSEVPLGAFIVAGGLYFVGRDGGGLYAMSMQCTHKGCTVGINGSELLCPCHQARFARDGKVLAGPATTPLPHLAVYVDAAGNISVDKYSVVSATARVPV